MQPTPPDLTLDQIMQHFSTDEAARKYLESVRWPDGPICPHCGCDEKIYPNEMAGVSDGLAQDRIVLLSQMGLGVPVRHPPKTDWTTRFPANAP